MIIRQIGEGAGIDLNVCWPLSAAVPRDPDSPQRDLPVLSNCSAMRRCRDRRRRSDVRPGLLIAACCFPFQNALLVFLFSRVASAPPRTRVQSPLVPPLATLRAIGGHQPAAAEGHCTGAALISLVLRSIYRSASADCRCRQRSAPPASTAVIIRTGVPCHPRPTCASGTTVILRASCFWFAHIQPADIGLRDDL